MSLLSLTATVTAAKAVAATEAAHTTYTTARGHQARRHDSTTARGHEDNDLVSQGIAVAPCPPPPPTLPTFVCLASCASSLRLASHRVASHRSASAFLVHNASESDNATASQSLPLSLLLSLLILGTVSRLPALYACRLHC